MKILKQLRKRLIYLTGFALLTLTLLGNINAPSANAAGTINLK